MNTGTGGPVFPHENPNFDGNWDKRAQIGGMTLRDYFAAKAMRQQPLFPSNGWQFCRWLFGLQYTPASFDFSYDAKRAYQQADAMLAERNK